MRLSATDIYAFQALGFLATQAPGHWVSSEGISDATGVARPYLLRVLAMLTARDLVASKKGVGGGYALSRAAPDISLRDVMRAVDGPVAPLACVSLNWRVPCPEERRCHVRGSVWEKVRDRLLEVLADVSVADLATDFRHGVTYDACLDRLLSPRIGPPTTPKAEAP
ncbi:MAG TPA: Rrf2 family transcriptional regulator [Trueperaceae bacterium]|nr:Rrf2 family transcriptional regulator [Trueperaceae bacterium]